jgi:hypothetical protein
MRNPMKHTMKQVLRLFGYYKYEYKRPRVFIVFFSCFWVIFVGMTIFWSIYNKTVLLSSILAIFILPVMARMVVYMNAKLNGWK